MEKLLNKTITIAKRIFSVENEQKLLRFFNFIKLKSYQLLKPYYRSRTYSRLTLRRTGPIIIVVFILLLLAIEFFQNSLYGRKIRAVKELQSLYFDPIALLAVIENQDKHYLLIDVRSAKEYASSHLKGAINIDLISLNEKEIIRKYKEQSKSAKTVILYGYLSNSNLMLEGAQIFWQARINAQILSVSYNQFRNGFYEWYPQAELGGVNIDKYLERTTLPLELPVETIPSAP